MLHHIISLYLKTLQQQDKAPATLKAVRADLVHLTTSNRSPPPSFQRWSIGTRGEGLNGYLK